jgi:hypothetical protein
MLSEMTKVQLVIEPELGNGSGLTIIYSTTHASSKCSLNNLKTLFSYYCHDIITAFRKPP